jgi:hypothetical protein
MKLIRSDGKLKLIIVDDLDDDDRSRLMEAYKMGLIFLIAEYAEIERKRGRQPANEAAA